MSRVYGDNDPIAFLSMRCKRWRFLNYSHVGGREEGEVMAGMSLHRVKKCCALMMCVQEACGRTFHLVI